MSTFATIAIKNKDGSILACQKKGDGYPSGVGAMLSLYYDTPQKVRALINLGDILHLCPTVEETRRENKDYEGWHNKPVLTKKGEEWRMGEWDYLYEYGRWHVCSELDELIYMTDEKLSDEIDKEKERLAKAKKAKKPAKGKKAKKPMTKRKELDNMIQELIDSL